MGKIGMRIIFCASPGVGADERRKMQEHPMIGVKIVEQVGLRPKWWRSSYAP
jgi:hypothetical protein